jgi:tetratricopeptide (TPR) repeat protein
MIGKILEKQEFRNVAEVNHFLRENIMGRNLDELLAESEAGPEEQAQQLACQAMETEDLDETLDLLNRALELDPDNTDALAMVATLMASNDKERVGALAAVVRRAEEYLGSSFFGQNQGDFWAIVETRPYMRARATLISLLIRTGFSHEAITHCEEMLQLNSNDNQGIRDTLMGLYLKTDNLQGARDLLDQYPGSFLAVFNWGRVLERFLSGELEEAKKAVTTAHRANRYVRDYLTGHKSTPQLLPEFYSLGDVSEAQMCAAEIGDAWRSHPEAVQWLKSLRAD